MANAQQEDFVRRRITELRLSKKHFRTQNESGFG